MTAGRRELLVAGLLAATGLFPRLASAYQSAAFGATSVADAVRALGAAAPVESAAVSVSAPDVAEDGALVSLGAATTLAGVVRVLILVEKNPSPLVALFDVSDAVEPSFALRARVVESSAVYAVAVTADGRAHFARRELQVIEGGCGWTQQAAT